MKLHHLLYILIISVLSLTAQSCIEDGIDSSPSSQPTFSVDTLKMGLAFTEQGTPTHSFAVYNRHDKILSISDIAMRGNKGFRLNVDGQSGNSFHNIEIRPNDSILVFVEATVGPNGQPEAAEVTDCIDFTTNGVLQTVVVQVTAQDVTRQKGIVIERDTVWSGPRPYQIFDSLVVRPGATLTLAAGARLYFHDKAYMRVQGSLKSLGTSSQPVILSGDRTDCVVGDLSFDLMASQWKGMVFETGSRNNALSHTEIRNTSIGVYVDSLSELSLLNCNLRNSAGAVLTAYHARIKAVGTVFSEAVTNAVLIQGGDHQFNHCTFANYYLRKYPTEPLVCLVDAVEPVDDSELPLVKAQFTNCILYGLSSDVSPGDLTGSDVTFTRCLFKSACEDDDNFIDCIWDADPLYYTVREDYIFDYRLKPESPAANAGYKELMLPEAATDFYGVKRDKENPSLGAYEYVEPPQDQTK